MTTQIAHSTQSRVVHGSLTGFALPMLFRALPALIAVALSLVGNVLSAATQSVRDFGAVGDGVAKDTRAFQQALDACAVNGGGEVVVPSGRFLIGSVQLGNRTTLRLEPDAVIVGSPSLTDYPLGEVRWEGRWQIGRRALIWASAVGQIGIVGPGRIEGSDWKTNGPDGLRNPVVLEPISCDGVRWDGFTVVQGGHWATHPTYCTNVDIRNLTITGRRDGIDVDSCRGVRIEACTITTGDDCISLKSGRGMDGARIGRACEDVTIRNCTLTDTKYAAIGIGSEGSGGIRHVRIEACRLRGHTVAIYLKSRIGRGGAMEDISVDNVDILESNFLTINLVGAGNKSTADDPIGGLAGYTTARNFRFSNIRLHSAKVLLNGSGVSAVKPLQGLVLADVTGSCETGITLANMSDVQVKGIAATGFRGPLLRTHNVSGTGLEGAEPLPAPVDPAPGNSPGHEPTLEAVKAGASR